MGREVVVEVSLGWDTLPQSKVGIGCPLLSQGSFRGSATATAPSPAISYLGSVDVLSHTHVREAKSFSGEAT